MKLRKFLRGEEGATAVVVALCMTVLMGCTAFAMDYGMMVMHRQSLQNAVDAAVLAGAQDLDKGEATVRATVKEYCRLNGFDPDTDDTVQMDIQVTETQLAVSLREDVRMGFSSVVTGKNIQTVGASAKAGVEEEPFFASCPYAMFASDPNGFGLLSRGVSMTIEGDIHSNSDIYLRTLTMKNGTATAVGQISFLWWGDEHSGNSSPVEDPQIDRINDYLEEKAVTVTTSSDNNYYLSSMISQARRSRSLSDLQTNGLFIHVDGFLGLYGPEATTYNAEFPVVIIADTGIMLNGSNSQASEKYPLILITKSGNIDVNGGSSNFYGIMYAPEGDITLQGVTSAVGRLIAENVTILGGTGTIGYSEEYDDLIPVGGSASDTVRLFE